MDSVEVGQAKLREIHEVMEQIALDSTKFFTKGNKAAGVRARKALQDLKQLAQDLRVAIQRCKSEGVHTRAIEHNAAVGLGVGAPPPPPPPPQQQQPPPPGSTGMPGMPGMPGAPPQDMGAGHGVDPLVGLPPHVPDGVAQHAPPPLAAPQPPPYAQI